ncbi:hypothetical protein BBI17_007118 [Phytophthora kernoviae]|uniref:RWP-RK domain-containing protein n=1 Tax=Phytophthora kernoviae TaxID=325452 RepID=A0A3R7G5V4_9STRA|nr:hypothetical protein JM18_006630 [Phytophthora kernoviae]RLN31684.1 hypothetical protein BBI17_007118 [Phytophthora kernoviae]
MIPQETMISNATPNLSSDDMLMGEILMSLKRDTPATIKLEPSAPAAVVKLEQQQQPDSYRHKMIGLSVQVSSGEPQAHPGAVSPADVFNFDAFNTVSPMAASVHQVLLHPPPNGRAVQLAVSPKPGPNRRYGPVVQLDDLRQCFNMPIAAVARKFGICATLLKKICRRHGIQRVAKGTNKEYIAKKIAAFEYTLECIMEDPNTAAKGISAGRLASPASEEMVKRGSRAKNRKKAASPSPMAALSDDEEAVSGTATLPAVVQQDWVSTDAPGPSAQRLNTRRASVPMSLQSILC